MTLYDCPVGLFRWGDVICLKTEYFLPSGKVEAYIVSSGELFCGPSKVDVVNDAYLESRTVEGFNSIEVTPLKAARRGHNVIITEYDEERSV